MAKEKRNGAENDWEEGESTNRQTQPTSAVNPTAPSPASPTAPGKADVAWKFPPNASRDDCLRVKAAAEKALAENPTYEVAKNVLAEANERLRFFTPSGQPVPRPVAAKAEATTDETSEDNELPKDAMKARALHAEIKRQPVRNIPQRDAKRAKLAKLAAHIARLENGMPTIVITADHHAEMYQNRDAGLKRTKLELLSRQIPEVKQLLADHDALNKAYDSLGSVNKELSEANAKLAKENTELNELLKKA